MRKQLKNAIRQQNFRDRKKEQGKEVEEVKQVCAAQLKVEKKVGAPV